MKSSLTYLRRTPLAASLALGAVITLPAAAAGMLDRTVLPIQEPQRPVVH